MLRGRGFSLGLASVTLCAGVVGCGEEFSSAQSSDGTGGEGAPTSGGASGGGGTNAGGTTGGTTNGGASSGGSGAAAGMTGGCEALTRTLPAIDAISLDYGPPPVDAPESEPLVVSTGFSHEHEHDFTMWLKFDLSEIPKDAELESLVIRFFCLSVTGEAPPLGVYYSEAVEWSAATATPEAIPRSAQVGDEGTLAYGVVRTPIDVSAYSPYWSNDTVTGTVTLGVSIIISLQDLEMWGEIAPPSDEPAGVEPVLEFGTCE